MLYRCYLKRETKKYFIGYDHVKNKMKILKNEYTKNFGIENDYNFYAKMNKGILGKILIPISDEEAGVTPVKTLSELGITLERKNL